MKLNIIAPDDPALDVLKVALSKRPDFDTKLKVIPWSSYRDILMETLKADTAPNQALFVPGHMWIPELANAGYLADLTTLMTTLDNSIVQEYDMDDIVPSVLSECHYDDKLYQLPFFSDGHILFYRTDLLSLDTDDDVPVISTKTVAKLAQQIHNPPHIFGLALKADISEIFTDFLPYLWENDGRIFDKTGAPDLANKNNIEALKFYCSLRQFCPDKTDTYGNVEIANSLRSGEAALISTWGGQIAPIVLDTNNRYKDRYKAAIFPKPWNATWGVAIPKNQPDFVQQKMLSNLLQLLVAKQDRQITKIAGSPIRKSSYTAEQLKRYPWLGAQKKMLESAKILPKDPKIGLFLGTLYEAVHKAFTNQISPKKALEKAQEEAMKHYS